jgi:hypothetical protein
MNLHPPFIIGPDLCPALKIDNGFVSLEYAVKRSDRNGPNEGRTVYRYFIDPGDGKRPFVGKDLRSGCQGGTIQEGFVSLLGFLGAEAEAWDNGRITPANPAPKGVGDNAGMFPVRIAQFACDNSDEIGMLQCEIEESETPLIVE